jgi:NitT/TauT family transport system ATP-binding protein
MNVARPLGTKRNNGVTMNDNAQQRKTTSAAVPVLRVTGLTKSYQAMDGTTVLALGETSLQLNDGEFVSVVGPSGCGKSTLLKLITGIVPHTTGEITYEGQSSDSAQKKLGVVFQSPVLLPWLTVLENVLLPIRVLKNMDWAAANVRGRHLLQLVGLEGFERKYPNELSGGMQQRASIARSLIHDPKLLLMDEPFGALDALTRERMSFELQRLWLANRKTVFFITHSILEAVFLSDRVLVMSERPGRILRTFDIPFSRPRDFNVTTTSAEFGKYIAEIRSLLGAPIDA